MAKYITRNEVAERFGVSPQTISNWAAKGFLKGYRDANRVYFSVAAVEKLLDPINDVMAMEKKVAEERKRLSAELEKIDDMWHDVAECVPSSVFGTILNNVLRRALTLKERSEVELRYMDMFLSGMALSEIAEAEKCTMANVSNWLNKVAKDISSELSKVGEENELLRGEVKMLNNENITLKLELKSIKEGKKVKELSPEALAYLRVDIRSLDFSVRVKNILLSHDIETIGDLISINLQDLLLYRNCGKKSYYQIVDMLEDEILPRYKELTEG